MKYLNVQSQHLLLNVSLMKYLNVQSQLHKSRRIKKKFSHSFAKLLVASDLFRRLFRRITVSKSVLTTLKLVRSTLRELSN